MRLVDDRITVRGDKGRTRRNQNRADLSCHGAINLQPNSVIRQDAWRHVQGGADFPIFSHVTGIEIITDIVGNIGNPVADGTPLKPQSACELPP